MKYSTGLRVAHELAPSSARPQPGAIAEGAAAEILRQEMTMALVCISPALNMGVKTHLLY
jgi:hypothetical protein